MVTVFTLKEPATVIAVIEDGFWRVKSVKTGEYLTGKEPWDKHRWAPRWHSRESISDGGWSNPSFAAWGSADDDLAERSAKMIAALAGQYFTWE